MIVFDSLTKWDDRAFYFSGILDGRVVAKVWEFRTEAEYDASENPELKAINLVRKVIDCVRKHPYLVLVDEIWPPSHVRRYKGVLWEYKKLKQLPNQRFQIDCGENATRLGAIVDLSNFDFDSDGYALFDRLTGLVVLSDLPLDSMVDLVIGWVSKDRKSIFGFDFDTVGSALRDRPSLGVLRYLFSEEPRREVIVVVADDSFIEHHVCELIDCISGNS